MSTIDRVREFHDAFGVTNREEPGVPEWDGTVPSHLATYGARLKTLSEELLRAAKMNQGNTPLLRLHLIVEETSELAEAMAKGDIVSCLDALCDLQYVLDGTTLALGLQGVFREGFDEVHRSNMSKLEDGRPVVSDAGRVMKGRDYTPPDLERVMNNVRS